MKSEYEMIRYMPITADSVLAKKSISGNFQLQGHGSIFFRKKITKNHNRCRNQTDIIVENY